MKKRLRKKLSKKAQVQALASIPKGYGIIVGNKSKYDDDKLFHHYKIGAVVKVIGMDAHFVHCLKDGVFNQTVRKEHIEINN